MFYDLAKPFEALDAEVERELLTLAMALARQIVRRELKTDPTQSSASFARRSRRCRSRRAKCACICTPKMPPWCASIWRPTENERAWAIVEDPVMARGGCQITTATSRIDARLETRLGAILSELLGTERHARARGGGT